MRRPSWVEAMHAKARDGSPKVNAHVIAPMPDAPQRDKLVAAVNGSSVYGHHALADPVTNLEGLKGYLLQEMTPQAAWRTGIRRNKGSHPLGELGGDRVRVSDAVREGLERSGRMERWTRTYAARRPRAVAEPTTWQFDAEGQGVLFDRLPDTDAPQRERGPTPRPKIEPAPMLRLFTVVGNVDVLAAMKGLGETHEEIGRRLGLSRPQTTNILNAQFRPSREVVRRVLELARAA